MLSTSAAAALLGVTPARVRQLVIAGRIKATRWDGRTLMIDPRDLDAYRAAPPLPPGRPRKTNRH